MYGLKQTFFNFLQENRSFLPIQLKKLWEAFWVSCLILNDICKEVPIIIIFPSTELKIVYVKGIQTHFTTAYTIICLSKKYL